MVVEHSLHPIEVGLVADEPMRLEGLISVFEAPPLENRSILVPITGALHTLLLRTSLRYLVLDLDSMPVFLQTLEVIRRERPEVRLIVIGPPNDEALIMDSVIAGARAYVDINATMETVRMAIEAVIAGSIWAPRHLLSRLIDRLLRSRDGNFLAAIPPLTERERQVLELILLARSNREIASQLGIEERTVKAYVGRLMRKAGANNRVKLSMSALGYSVKQRAAELEAEQEAGRAGLGL
jgi:DNA-binding NarL/FixJ family response regulator